jgi:hypothetical protein
MFANYIKKIIMQKVFLTLSITLSILFIFSCSSDDDVRTDNSNGSIVEIDGIWYDATDSSYQYFNAGSFYTYEEIENQVFGPINYTVSGNTLTSLIGTATFEIEDETLFLTSEGETDRAVKYTASNWQTLTNGAKIVDTSIDTANSNEDSFNAYAELSRSTCISLGERPKEVCDCIYETMIENDINSQEVEEEKQDLLVSTSAQCALSGIGLPDLGGLEGFDLGGLDLSESSDLSDLFSNLDFSNLTSE